MQGRHILTTVALTLSVLAGVFVVFVSTQEARKDTSANLESRSQLLASSRKIQSALRQGYTSLDKFLLAPDQTQYAERSLNSFDKARLHTQKLLGHDWLIGKTGSSQFFRLPTLYNQLLKDIDYLVSSRKDPAMQYPALFLGNQSLNPNRTAFANAMAIAINESSSELEQPISLEAFIELIQARYLWNQMVSNFRIYMANQLGAFNENLLTGQEESIETLYLSLRDQLNKLQQLNEQELLGFESSDALEALLWSSENWFNGFLYIKETYKNGYWRTDVTLMGTTVEPKLNEIWNLMLGFELMLERSVSSDIDELNMSASYQENLLWTISCVVLLIGVLSFLSMRRLIFSPIKLVTQALREEAIGESSIIMPVPLTLETRNLVDAFSEMRSQIHQRQRALEYKSLYDELTGLPNRSLCFDRIKQSLFQAQIKQSQVALIAIDIPHLKEVNDTIGHDMGDRVLIEIGNRLQRLIDQYDTLSRSGGDEFVIVLNNTSESEALDFADKMDAVLSKNHKIQESNFQLSSVMGVAVYPQHGENYSQLYQHAEIAKHGARLNRCKVRIYSEEEDEFSKNRLNLTRDLKLAIETNTLALHYQPKLGLKGGEVIGVEALLRWDHAIHGWINAEEVILIAEQYGLIERLTHWTIETGVKRCAEWRKLGLELSVAINLSVHILQNDNFSRFVQTTLDNYQLPAKYLVLEITESAMMINPLKASTVISQLDHIGVVLSADDFGTGFSSFSYIKHIPIDEIKIDKSFVSDMVNNQTDTAIVKSAIDLAHSLGLTVVAEGVETNEARLALQDLNCEIGQGYYFSKPLPEAAFIKWLKSYTLQES